MKYIKLLSDFIPPIIYLVLNRLKNQIDVSRAWNKIARYEKLHLACGSNIINGWANIDLLDQKPIIRLILTDQLPVKSNTIRFIYSEHCIGHINQKQAKRMLSECYRVLHLGGVIRVFTPDLAKIIDEYLAGRLSEWNDVGWSPLNTCQMLNEGMRLWGYQFIYDTKELQKLFADCGFREITLVKWRESRHPVLQ